LLLSIGVLPQFFPDCSDADIQSAELDGNRTPPVDVDQCRHSGIGCDVRSGAQVQLPAQGEEKRNSTGSAKSLIGSRVIHLCAHVCRKKLANSNATARVDLNQATNAPDAPSDRIHWEG
jgi:hypothetical protein